MKRGAAWFAATAVALALLPAPAAGQASPEQRRDEISRELSRLRSQIDEAVAEEAELAAELTVSRRYTAALDARLRSLDVEIAGVEAELVGAQSVLDRAEARYLGAQARVGRARRALADARDRLREQAVSAYIGRGRTFGHVDVLLQARDVRQLQGARSYLDTIISAQHEVVRAHQAQRAETEELAADMAIARQEALAQRDVVVGHRASLRAARSEQAATRSAAAAEVARHQELLRRAQSQRSAYESRRAQLQRESQDIAALLRRRQAGQPAILCGRGSFGQPLANPRISSGFGYRTHPIFGERRLHSGIDYSAGTGTPILAAGDGTVLSAGRRGGYGNTIVIDHGGSIATLYAHQSSLAVDDGATVRRGQVIGAVGSTGFSTGPHLHFEVRVGGTPVDPLACL